MRSAFDEVSKVAERCGGGIAIIEALAANGLLPMQWCDGETGPRWWCQSCHGLGRLDRDAFAAGRLPRKEAKQARNALRPSAFGVQCSSMFHCVAHDPPASAVVAIASLGMRTITVAESLAREVIPGARIVWREATGASINRHHNDLKTIAERHWFWSHDAVDSIAQAFSVEVLDELWHSTPPSPPRTVGERVVRAWPALTAINGLGLHLLAEGEGFVTLGVETAPSVAR